MRVALVIALLAPSLAFAQGAAPPNNQAGLAASLAKGWSEALAQNDVLLVQLQDLQQQLIAVSKERDALKALAENRMQDERP